MPKATKPLREVMPWLFPDETEKPQMLAAHYPQTWDDFIGQEPVKRQLKIACRAAKMRGKPLNHVLLASGIPGVGKTALAQLIVKELDTGLKVLSGRITLNDARIALAGLTDRDVLFIDEIHRMVQGGKANAEWLLHLLADGVLMGPLGPEEQPKITVVAATTDKGRLPATILDRFKLQPAIEPYTDDEAMRIVAKMSESVFEGLEPPNLLNQAGIALAANNNPRMIRALLENLRDLVITDEVESLQGEYDLTEALDWIGLTPDGLDRTGLRYLYALLNEFGGQAGERALVDRLQEPGGLGHVERVLMDKGFIAKTNGGRTLTALGIKRAKVIPPPAQ